MNDETGYLRRLTYTCIFAVNANEASANAYRLISEKECGFTEGLDKWIEVLEGVLSKPLNINELNFFATSHDALWWHEFLSVLLKKLSAELT